MPNTKKPQSTPKTYQADEPCNKCGGLLRYYSRNRCVSCDKFRDKQRGLTKHRINVKWESNLRTKYGMTAEHYWALFDKQCGKCAICRKPPGRIKLAVDHCHHCNMIRGLLCKDCNTAIGLLADSVPHLCRAIDYLTLYPCN